MKTSYQSLLIFCFIIIAPSYTYTDETQNQPEIHESINNGYLRIAQVIGNILYSQSPEELEKIQTPAINITKTDKQVTIKGRPYSKFSDVMHGGLQDSFKNLFRFSRKNTVIFNFDDHGNMISIVVEKPSDAHRFQRTHQDFFWGEKRTQDQIQLENDIAAIVYVVKKLSAERAVRNFHDLVTSCSETSDTSHCTFISKKQAQAVAQKQPHNHAVDYAIQEASGQSMISHEDFYVPTEQPTNDDNDDSEETFWGLSGGNTPLNRSFNDNLTVAQKRLTGMPERIQKRFEKKN